MSPLRRLSCGAAACVAVLALLAHAAGGEDSGFMPKGGRTLLLELQPSADELRRIAQTRRGEAQWAEFVATRGPKLEARQAQTLVAYLSVNMPLPPAALQAASTSGELAAALPRDGRELAWEQCQFCHSLFTSHLTQGRTAQAWRNMFESPFHRQLKMTPQEREEFARYSELNMPMRLDDVPPELKF